MTARILVQRSGEGELCDQYARVRAVRVGERALAADLAQRIVQITLELTQQRDGLLLADRQSFLRRANRRQGTVRKGVVIVRWLETGQGRSFANVLASSNPS
jgi:hypothetical protein